MLFNNSSTTRSAAQSTTQLEIDTINNEYYQEFQSLNNDWQNEVLQDSGWIGFKVISPKKLGRVTFANPNRIEHVWGISNIGLALQLTLILAA